MTNKLHIPTLADIRSLSGLGGLSGAAGPGGYLTRSDTTVGVSGQTVDGQSFADIWRDLQLRTAIFNRHYARIVSLFSFRTTQAQVRVAVPVTGAFGEASEFGRPNKLRFAQIFRGLPRKHYDLGYGFTQEYLDSVQDPGEVNAIQAAAQQAWNALSYQLALEALMFSTNRTSEEGVSVKALYNNDGEVPPAFMRTTHAGTHTHYLTTNNAAVTAASLLAAEAHLMHHGYGNAVAGTGGTIIHLFNNAEMATVRALVGFIPAPNGTVPVIVDGNIVGAVPTGVPAGLTVQGYFGSSVIVQEDMVPAGYFITFSTGGAFATQNVLGWREHENPSARGMRLIEGGRREYPLIDSVYDGYMGMGVRHRGAAAVTQVVVGTTYNNPTI